MKKDTIFFRDIKSETGLKQESLDKIGKYKDIRDLVEQYNTEIEDYKFSEKEQLFKEKIRKICEDSKDELDIRDDTVLKRFGAKTFAELVANKEFQVELAKIQDKLGSSIFDYHGEVVKDEDNIEDYIENLETYDKQSEDIKRKIMDGVEKRYDYGRKFDIGFKNYD